MKLRIMKRTFTAFAKTKDITDETGAVRYHLNGDTKSLHLLDAAGNEIAEIRQKLSFFSKFAVTVNGRALTASQHGENIEIAPNGWRTFGFVYGAAYALMSDETCIAEINRLPHPDGTVLEVFCREPESEVEILACVIAVELAELQR